MPYALREALAAFRRAPLLTGLSSAMVALALFVIGLFGLVAYNIRRAIERVEERVEIVAYLRDDATAAEVALAHRELAALPEVLDLREISKDEALEVARRELTEFQEIFADLEVNPLPASMEIRLRPGSRNAEAVDRLVRHAAAYPFVEDVRYGREWLDKVFLIRRVGGAAAAVLGTAFAVAAALIIGTAVRIAIFARRDEIQVMRLVGAKDGFIRRPFLLEGLLTGLVGGLGAALFTYGTYLAIRYSLFRLEWVPTVWVTGGIAAGALLGVLASLASVHRHLRGV
ncbi:MAG: ABC transporter permease [Gemmatimonadetes bacterium]|nr:ABC transporter permease [Gemmatimonadota bacterium]